VGCWEVNVVKTRSVGNEITWGGASAIEGYAVDAAILWS